MTQQAEIPSSARANARMSLPYVETSVVTAVIIAVSLFAFPGRWGLMDANPHPLWLVVIFAPLMYGLAPGMFSGILLKNSLGIVSNVIWCFSTICK